MAVSRREVPAPGAWRSRAFRWAAHALTYPHPGLRAELEVGLVEVADPAARQAFQNFLAAVAPLAPGAWEEGYTRAFDLHPAAAPYVGYHVFGDSPDRGGFLAALAAAQRRLEVGSAGELPDHLVPVLGYLAAAEETGQAPLPELVHALPQALRALRAGLERIDPTSPYRHLLAWLEQAGAQLYPEPGGPGLYPEPGGPGLYPEPAGPELTDSGRRQ